MPMNERGIRSVRFKVFALGTPALFVGTDLTGNALVRAASDGLIALSEQAATTNENHVCIELRGE